MNYAFNENQALNYSNRLLKSCLAVALEVALEVVAYSFRTDKHSKGRSSFVMVCLQLQQRMSIESNNTRISIEL